MYPAGKNISDHFRQKQSGLHSGDWNFLRTLLLTVLPVHRGRSIPIFQFLQFQRQRFLPLHNIRCILGFFLPVYYRSRIVRPIILLCLFSPQPRAAMPSMAASPITPHFVSSWYLRFGVHIYNFLSRGGHVKQPTSFCFTVLILTYTGFGFT